MKKTLKKLMIFEISLIILTILFMLLPVMSAYLMVLYLILITFIFKIIFHTEKHKRNLEENNLLEITVFLMTFFVLYYLFGLLVGFTRISNYSWNSIVSYAIPLTLYILLREFLRYNILKKTELNDIATAISILLFIVLDLANGLYYIDYRNAYGTMMYLSLSVFPVISSNIVYSFLSKRSGYRPIIFYSLIIGLYRYILPIIPNANVLMTTLLNTLLPILLWVRMSSFYERVENPDLDRRHNYTNISILIAPSILVAIMIYFFSGYFRYYTIAIASDSMSPTIQRGDIVIIDQKRRDSDALEEGEVIAYKKDNRIIIHRIVDKTKVAGKYVFLTKGDSNNSLDDYSVEEENIVGTVYLKIKYLGLPTVWLNGQ